MGPASLDRPTLTALLTVVIVGLWIVTAVVRIWVDWPEAAVLDAAMPLVCAFYFAKRNGATA